MSQPFVAQLMLVPYNFNPRGWAFCAGQLLPISQNTALFSLLGTFYGGDGKSTFGLPNLQGRVPIGFNQGPGLSDYALGQFGGEENVSLLTSEIPVHTHTFSGSGGPGGSSSPVNGTPARLIGGTPYAPSNASLTQQMNVAMIQPAGSSFPHNNLMPYLTLNWLIALQGVFPARN